MPLSSTLRSSAGGRGLVGAIAAYWDLHVAVPLAEHRKRIRLNEELSQLDHRELKDLGISDPVSYADRWRPRF